MPLQPPLAVQLFALVELQDSVVAAPLFRFVAALVRLTVGAGTEPGVAGVEGVVGTAGSVGVPGAAGCGVEVPRVGDLVSATENGPWVTGADRSLELPEHPPSSKIEHRVAVEMNVGENMVDLTGLQLADR